MSRTQAPRLRSAVVLLVALGWLVGGRVLDGDGRPSFAEGESYDGVGAGSADGGSYSFLRTFAGTDYPVTYGRCRDLAVLIDPTGAPPGGSEVVLDAMRRVSELSGLSLRYAGPTSERPGAWRARMLEGGGIEAYPPALVSWSSEEESPELGGDVVGVGGPISLRGGGITVERFFTGSVVLEADWFAEHLGGDEEDRTAARAVVLHELGHLVGLGHTDDRDELMYDAYVGQRDFGPGDRAGLRRLGGGDC